MIFRIGGYPNEQNGDLALAHIPYSFKVCAFMEAYKLGYKRALWLDAPIRPLINLNIVFDKIANKGFFCYWDTTSFTKYCKKDHHYKLIGLNREKAEKLFTISLGIVGIDFTNKKGLPILYDWYYETKYNPKSSFNAFLETTILSKIVNNYYEKKDFPYFLAHVYCNQHTFSKLTPQTKGVEFTYNKKDVEPNWPEY